MMISWQNQIRNKSYSYNMRKSRIIIIASILSIIIITLVTNSIPVLAYNKNGSTPIPGNLFPHPSISHNDKIPKHAVGKLDSLQFMPQT